MLLSSMLPELTEVTLSFAISFAEPNNGNIKSYAAEICKFAFVNHEFSRVCAPTLKNLKEKFHLFEAKYSGSNGRYSMFKEKDPLNAKFLGNPQLLTALTRGLHPHPELEVTPEIEADLESMINLMPKSLNHGLKGFIYDDDTLPPLAIACINHEIPLGFIEFLIKKGANLDVNMRHLEEKRHYFDDERFENVMELVNKYYLSQNPGAPQTALPQN